MPLACPPHLPIPHAFLPTPTMPHDLPSTAPPHTVGVVQEEGGGGGRAAHEREAQEASQQPRQSHTLPFLSHESIPVGHTGYSWNSDAPLPLGHTPFSWTAAASCAPHPAPPLPQSTGGAGGLMSTAACADAGHLPVGHTDYSWKSQAAVPLGHTFFSWTSASLSSGGGGGALSATTRAVATGHGQAHRSLSIAPNNVSFSSALSLPLCLPPSLPLFLSPSLPCSLAPPFSCSCSFVRMRAHELT